MRETIFKLFEQSLQELLVADKKSILNDVSERNLCGRLAIYLTYLLKEFNIQGYYAETEYNRKQDGQVKTMLEDGLHVVNISCDLIIHSRGENKALDNLLTIEMKKSYRPEEEKRKDRIRLKTLTKRTYDDVWSADGKTLPEHVCGYVLGAYLELNIRANKCLVETYESGALTGSWEKNL